jgi:competence protein ComEC
VPPALPWCALLGCLACHLLPSAPALRYAFAPLLVPLLLVSSAMLVHRWRRRPWRTGAAAFVAGFVYTLLVVAIQLGNRLEPQHHGDVLLVEGRVAGLSVSRHGNCRFALDTNAVDGRARRMRLRVSWRGVDCRALTPGSRWVFHVRSYLPRGLSNPGSFDYEGWLFREGFGGTAWVEAQQPVRRLADARLHGAVDRARVWLAGRMRASLAPSIAAAAPLIEALSLGLRAEIEPALWDALAATGTGHLFAISGLHVGMMAGAALWSARRLPVGSRAAGRARCGLLPALLAWCSCAAYAALAGFSVATRRALVAVSLALGATVLKRECGLLDLLARGLLVVLALDPLAPLSAGFWLSFGAVACLGLLGRVLGSRRRCESISQRLEMAGAVQAGLWLAMMPIGVLCFDRISWLAPVVNMLLIPLFALLVLPCCLAGTVLAAVIPPLAAPVLQLAGESLLIIADVLRFIARLPWGAGEVSRPAWTLLLAQVGVLLLLLPGVPARWTAVPLCLPALLWQPPAPAPGTLQLVVLDVGQGLAVVVRTRHHALLFDAGPAFRSGSSTGAIVVVPYLVSAGVRQLDRILVSHADSDHRGGLAHVLAAYPQAPVSIGGASALYAPCRAGQQWEWDGVRFTLLHPPDARWRGNDGSCVLRIRVGSGADARHALLTGDIEASAEWRLVAEHGADLAADVVVVPHHGSRSSSTAAFVDAVSPRFAVFATGFRNRWGLPHPQVEARWQDRGASTADTAVTGALTVTLVPGRAPRVSAHRHRRQRYWMINSERRVPRQGPGL